MKLNDSSRLQIRIDALRFTQDPTGGTLVLTVDGTDHACTWDGPATQDGGTWTRAAHTNDFFAGPAVPIGAVSGATVLGYGVHAAELRLTLSGLIVASVVESIAVRAD